MSKLCQIIVVCNGKKSKFEQAKTEVYKKVQSKDLFDGLQKDYIPDTEDGETIPGEKKNVQYTVNNAIEDFSAPVVELMDLILTQDCANTTAKADVVVDGVTIVKEVPVTHLLFLEKQLNDVHTFFNKLHTLDPADTWSYNENIDAYSSETKKTNRTKKVLKSHVKYDATEQHPAQVETYSEDVKIGTYATIKFSGAIPAKKKNEMLKRINKLIDAVKAAREEANSINVTQKEEGASIMKYILN